MADAEDNANETTTNGRHTPEAEAETATPLSPHTPKPKHTSFALTEYSVNPSPKTTTTTDKKSVIPEHLLLPNGYPDVSQVPDITF
jgi:threonine dehydratase